ncbi:HpcH/HpaI aldolase/citrate lyase family protein [Methylovirgula sp. 4M-Z18]|uniref:HpcH/HpaI aldolase/citrate lyase family protein n=1 Tax=Methylovirgula sp. 4M-Z18 TaxID=2293567 RepID=UPI000E2F6020|nr:CoA ester lyase [Methylovirgula sp. 4M-Z18]RFB78597.1 CoA ester lyase [Methylovirgula sp. 4M-Z18]
MIRPRRSALYMPGSNARALEKARTLAADALILDLEDAVAPDAKVLARDQVCAAVRAGGYGPREVVIRINGLTTEWGKADLEAAAAARPDAVLIPKVSNAPQVQEADALLKAQGASAVGLWAMMETPLAMLQAAEIAAAGQTTALSVFVMGTNDLAKETRARLVPGRAGMLPWLMTCVAAARAHGVEILDGVWNNFADEAGFRAECEQGRDLGMDGKTLIHPNQLSICNEVFAPGTAEVAWARKIVGAFDLPENANKGALQLDGKMVERLHADMARHTLAVADAIAARVVAG